MSGGQRPPGDDAQRPAQPPASTPPTLAAQPVAAAPSEAVAGVASPPPAAAGAAPEADARNAAGRQAVAAAGGHEDAAASALGVATAEEAAAPQPTTGGETREQDLHQPARAPACRFVSGVLPSHNGRLPANRFPPTVACKHLSAALCHPHLPRPQVLKAGRQIGGSGGINDERAKKTTAATAAWERTGRQCTRSVAPYRWTPATRACWDTTAPLTTPSCSRWVPDGRRAGDVGI